MADQRLMKEGLDSAAIRRISDSLERTINRFPRQSFTQASLNGLQSLELKDRVRHIINVLNIYLPTDFTEAANILIQLKSNWDSGDPNDNLSGFAAWPIIDYVGEHGLDHPKTALDVLKKLTPLFSAEFAIRPFIINHFELTFQTLEKWAPDPDEHVRRLVSEGSRPRLPWGQQLPQFIKDPSPALKLLEKLKDDPSEYVRRSVANNLNDISKDHPEMVIAVCRRWKKGATAECEWIIRHATRTLVKSGHPDVFGLLGYTENPRLGMLSLETSPEEIKLGDTFSFRAVLKSESRQTQKVIVDYSIHHMKANGKTSPKVFKFKTLKLAPGETIELAKRHTIKPITTRKYYPGEHAVEILINGKTFGRAPFTLRTY